MRQSLQLRASKTTCALFMLIFAVCVTPLVSKAEKPSKLSSPDVTVDLGNQSFLYAGELRCPEVLLQTMQKYPKANRLMILWDFSAFSSTAGFGVVYNRQENRLFYKGNGERRMFYGVTREALDAVAKANEPIHLIGNHVATDTP